MLGFLQYSINNYIIYWKCSASKGNISYFWQKISELEINSTYYSKGIKIKQFYPKYAQQAWCKFVFGLMLYKSGTNCQSLQTRNIIESFQKCISNIERQLMPVQCMYVTLYIYIFMLFYIFFFCLNARTSYFKFAFVQLISASVSCVYVELHQLMYIFI